MKTFLLIVLIILVFKFIVGEFNSSITGGKNLIEGAADSIEALFTIWIPLITIIGAIILSPIWLLGNALTGRMNYPLLFIIVVIIAFLH